MLDELRLLSAMHGRTLRKSPERFHLLASVRLVLVLALLAKLALGVSPHLAHGLVVVPQASFHIALALHH